MNKLPLSALIAGIITLSGSSYASDDLSFSNVEKTPSPAGPVPIPYPIIITTPEKPDQKSKENAKKVDKGFYRRGVPRIRKSSKIPATKLK